MEIFTDIKGYEGLYQVSNEGRVKSLGNNRTRKDKFLKPRRQRNGYEIVTLSKNHHEKELYVHILVATYHCDNWFEGAEVDHKDRVRHHNTADNLHWVTRAENLANSDHSRICKPVRQLTKDNQIVKEYESMTQAAAETGIDRSNIRHAIHHVKGQKYAGGYKWELV